MNFWVATHDTLNLQSGRLFHFKVEEEEQQARLTRWLVFKVEDVDVGDGDGDDN